MKRTTLALVASATLLSLAAPFAFAAPADSSTTGCLDRRFVFGLHVVPDPSCAGVPPGLRFAIVEPCDHLLSASVEDSGLVVLRVLSQRDCLPGAVPHADSFQLALPAFAAGPHAIEIEEVALVPNTTGDTCMVTLSDTLNFGVGACPPPAELPYVTNISIGEPICSVCTPRVCPGDSFPVVVSGVLPNDCYAFRGLRLLLSAAMGPRPLPPTIVVRIAQNNCERRPCSGASIPFEAHLKLPGLLAGSYRLQFVESREGLCDSLPLDSTFYASRSFTVQDSCPPLHGPPPPMTACYFSTWDSEVSAGCNAFLGAGTATLPLAIVSRAAIAGLQGELVLNPPGALKITALTPSGLASAFHISWSATPSGAKFLMFDESGHPIPGGLDKSDLVPLRVLLVTVASATSVPPHDVVTLGVRALIVSDTSGNAVPLCPTPAVAPDARICPGAGGCDLNHDGVSDIRDLVLMVRCLRGLDGCADTSLAALDCNDDGLKNLDDLLCCARRILSGGAAHPPGTRPEPGVQVSFGAPHTTASGIEVPVSVAGTDRFGAARLDFDFPSGAYDVTGADFFDRNSAWTSLFEVQGSRVSVGLLGIGAGDGSPLTFNLQLALKPGQQPAGNVRLTGGDFSGPDGAALAVSLAPMNVPVAGVTALALSAAEPNPFTDGTRFSVSLPRAARVELSVHDLAGRRVATVFRGTLEAGTHPFLWNGRGDDGNGLAGGVFFLRATADGAGATRKLVLLRRN